MTAAVPVVVLGSTLSSTLGQLDHLAPTRQLLFFDELAENVAHRGIPDATLPATTSAVIRGAGLLH